MLGWRGLGGFQMCEDPRLLAENVEAFGGLRLSFVHVQLLWLKMPIT